MIRTIMQITPALARELLTRRVEGTRPVLPGRVAELTALRKSGNWVNSPPLTLSCDEGRLRLTDGQHRLLALIETDHTAEFVVEIAEKA